MKEICGDVVKAYGEYKLEMAKCCGIIASDVSESIRERTRCIKEIQGNPNVAIIAFFASVTIIVVTAIINDSQQKSAAA